MNQHHYHTTPLGELIAAAFDSASRLSLDPIEVSRMATQSVSAMLGRALRVTVSLTPPGPLGLAKKKPQPIGAR